ncbi:sigma-70 family RNA polymerase sigma factor [Maribacter confluentis]|uniref:Sigma-70 family RNA polymerase sigma factor n=1 Tax=Maribacter confluentis TaxID=1656093 RepID=A0ABT8RUR2_9FLAO|nr:sigma-70 family RNA polymerase sigma factor [Maribacter confluentis]MDO1514654.1 sigma-70 family RNA polymerase sigma factor [Maribacter confluentis]
MELHSDETLWYFFKKGEHNAFSLLFKKFYPQLHVYGTKISSSPAITEDCLQNFFIQLFEERDKPRNIKNLKAYLFVSFKRRLIKQLQRNQKNVPISEAQLFMTNFTFSAEEISIRQEVQFLCTRTLNSLINQLSPRQKEVIYLKYYSEMNITDIAEVMDMNYQSVLNTLQKAMKKLRVSSENQQIKTILKKN